MNLIYLPFFIIQYSRTIETQIRILIAMSKTSYEKIDIFPVLKFNLQSSAIQSICRKAKEKRLGNEGMTLWYEKNIFAQFDIASDQLFTL